MDYLLEQISAWAKELLIDGIMNNLDGLFDYVNEEVGAIATEVGTTPAEFSPGIFSMIQNISETVIMPIAGIILTFICTWELIQLLIDHNNMANVEVSMIMKWIFKTTIAVMLITNCFTITMAVFDVAQYVISASGSIITADTAVTLDMMDTLRTTLEGMELGYLLDLYAESFVLSFSMEILSIAVTVIVYGRMIEIYLMVSLAPIPFATFGNREQSQIGQNYLRSLFALGFQGFLILVCVGIYAVIVQSITLSEDIFTSLWYVVAYTVLLVFSLFKTGSLAKSILSAH